MLRVTDEGSMLSDGRVIGDEDVESGISVRNMQPGEWLNAEEGSGKETQIVDMGINKSELTAKLIWRYRLRLLFLFFKFLFRTISQYVLRDIIDTMYTVLFCGVFWEGGGLLTEREKKAKLLHV